MDENWFTLGFIFEILLMVLYFFIAMQIFSFFAKIISRAIFSLTKYRDGYVESQRKFNDISNNESKKNYKED